MTSELSMRYAVRLLTRRHSGTWRESDETELQQWLAASGEHREAYDKAARAWNLAGSLQTAAPIAPAATPGSSVKRAGRSRGSYRGCSL